LKLVLLAKKTYNDPKKKKVVRACSMHEKGDKCIQDFGKPEGRRPIVHTYIYNTIQFLE
jgi:hypothetical protein